MYAELLEKYLDSLPDGSAPTRTQLRHLEDFSTWLESNAAQPSAQRTGFCPDHPDTEFVIYCPVEGCFQTITL